ncbi:MAG: TraR/DksA C4-type zinc finger protein [Vannielia sp.]|uniref:TraR/DksA family transcriptional regulator n=1 Tax=Vannielia sp. TaxID=2813045 RepID=UPI003B8DC121
MSEIDTRKAALETRLGELSARLHEIQGELVSHNSADWEELATERETDEVLEGRGVQGQAEIAAIRAALARIEAGDYGFCTQCGSEISQQRLDLLPQTPFCKSCAT